MILEMSPGEIDEFVLSQKVGRVGCHVADETYVVPVIYGWDADCIYVYTTEGKKVDMMRENPLVCFEIDEYQTSGGWRSVIAHGVFEELKEDDAARALQIISERVTSNREAVSSRERSDRGAGRTPVAFRIRTSTVTGRKVEVAS
jgi:nitroimidazol reductase NimA-like FMN-containing flavoprotein (pyridoxamine 5'-phosphate oxidase superfamily)